MSDAYLNLIDALRQHIMVRQSKLQHDNITTKFESRDGYVQNVAAYAELDRISGVIDAEIKKQNGGER